MIRPIALLAVFVLACQPIPPPLPPAPDGDSAVPPPLPPVDQVDASAPILDAALPITDVRPDLLIQGPACDQFCSVIDWIGCPEGRPTPGGLSCSQVCEGVHQFALKDFEKTLVSATKCRDVTCARKAGVKCK
jgi:hypothetical protein